MKNKNIIAILFALFILASCSPAVTAVPPTETVIPTSTFTPIPPTLTPTPAPEKITEAKDFSKWIDDYVHAYGGKIMVNNVEMDSSQLTNEVKANLDLFLQVKQINGSNFSLFVVNGVPLAIREPNDKQWQEMTLKTLGRFDNVIIGGMVEKYPNTERIYKEFDGGLINSNVWTTGKNGVNGELDFSYENFQLEYSKQFGYLPSNNILDSILWGAYLPSGFDSFSKEQAIAWMEKYITAVMEKHKNTIGAYIVVNEASFNDNIKKKVGSEYIKLAFQIARKVNPDAYLIYNQTDNHGAEGKFVNDTAQVGNELYNEGLIDAIGIQGHMVYDNVSVRIPEREQIKKILDGYKAPIVLTEFDVDLSFLSGSTLEKHILQATMYANLTGACLDTKRCERIYFYGAFPDKNSWFVLSQNEPNAQATLWDDNSQRKAAFYAIVQVLYEHVP